MDKMFRRKKDWEDPVPAFGSAMRSQEFLLDPNITFLNHGSFGTTPRRVFERIQEDMLMFEQDPNKGGMRDVFPEWERVIQALSVNLGTSADNLALVENTTAGVGNILSSFPFQSGDAILINNRTYGSMKNQVDDVIKRKRSGVTQVVLDYPFVIESSEQIVQLYRDVITANPNIRLTIVDHISQSVPAVYPVKEITQVCHEHGVRVIIDGAHGPGQVQLNLDDIGMDYYIGSLYKWGYSGRGCAIQYVVPSLHAESFPCRVSNNYETPYPRDFLTQGTRDESVYHTADYAMEFYNWVGGYDVVIGYSVPLLNDAISMLTQAWGTAKFPIPSTMEAPFLKSIRLPDLAAYEKNDGDAWRLMNDLYDLYNTWTVLLYFGEDGSTGEIYIRLSANIYNTMADYEHLRDAILELQQEAPTSDRQKKRKALFKEKKDKIVKNM